MNFSFKKEETEGNKFPSIVFGRIVKSFGEEVAQSMNSNIDFVYSGVLVAASIAIGSKFKGQVKNLWHESVIIWLAIIGEPGSKKTPSLKKAIDVVFELHIELVKNNPDGLNALITTDSTIESLVELLANNPHGLLLFRDEIMGWLGSMNQYKSGGGDDMEKYLSTFTAEPLIVTRKSKPLIQVENPFLSVVGGVQVDLLDELIKMKDNGFNYRILYCYPKPIPIQHTDIELDEESEKAYKEVIRYIFEFSNKSEPSILNFSADAKLLWVEWHKQFCSKMNDPFIPYYIKNIMSKLEAYSIRFSVILEFLNKAENRENIECVNESSVRGAILLVNYFLANAEKTFSSSQSSKIDKQIERALAFISKQPHSMVSLRKFYTNKVSGVKTAEEALNLLTEMQARRIGKIQHVNDTSPGKQTVNFHLAPDYVAKYSESGRVNS